MGLQRLGQLAEAGPIIGHGLALAPDRAGPGRIPGAPGHETSVRQVVHRLAHTIRRAGEQPDGDLERVFGLVLEVGDLAIDFGEMLPRLPSPGLPMKA